MDFGRDPHETMIKTMMPGLIRNSPHTPLMFPIAPKMYAPALLPEGGSLIQYPINFTGTSTNNAITRTECTGGDFFMKMIWAHIRSEKAQQVIDALEKTGVRALTRIRVADPIVELKIPGEPPTSPDTAREMVILVLADCEVAKAITTIRNAVRAGLKKNPDDEKTGTDRIFVTYVEDFYTLRAA